MALNRAVSGWSGRRVWLVGASSGIGAATAELLLARGARVAVSARSAQALEERFGARALREPLDVADFGAVQAAAERIFAAWGGLDLVMDFAGTYRAARAWQLDPEQARAMVEVNLLGALNVVAATQQRLIEQGAGGIALVSSVAGYAGLPNSLVYGATKAALINLAETLWLDLAPRGISVYLINPGFVETPLTAQNRFRMPALIGADEAAREILRGIERGAFDIHFPKRFTRVMKLLRLLPYPLYFRLVRRYTGL
jgi:NAD(P)-dependent dehydrogenase (short-subunit alcohol dehydrogenase family)